MKWSRKGKLATSLTLALTMPLAAAGLTACAGDRMPPKSLVDARDEFSRAKNGQAMQLDPTDVHEADLALQRAEQAWSDAPDDPNTLDLAIIAQRKAQIAENEAASMKSSQDAEAAKRELQSVMSTQLQSTRGQLDQTKLALNKTQDQLQAEQKAAEEQRKKLTDL
jgi:hypothetical protein